MSVISHHCRNLAAWAQAHKMFREVLDVERIGAQGMLTKSQGAGYDCVSEPPHEIYKGRREAIEKIHLIS